MDKQSALSWKYKWNLNISPINKFVDVNYTAYQQQQNKKKKLHTL